MPTDRKNEVTLKQAIDKLIDAYKLRGKFNELKLRDTWEEVVGEHIAKHTKKIKIKDYKLYVKVDSPVVKQELMFMRSRLLSLINRKFNYKIVDEIIIV
jgi:predicted nucleic acid-binding Zn ribbon protein